MKILYFILGSFSSKFEQWGLSSFDDLLEEDIIFFGPIEEDEFEYKSKKYKLIKFFDEISIQEVFQQLPANWYPDIVHCDTSILNYITDIHKCPVKTCLFAADAWANTVYNRKIVNFFDFTRYGIIDKEEYNKEETHLLSATSFAVSIPCKNLESKDFVKRKIDVLAISNYDSGFYQERFKILFKAAHTFNSKYRIEYWTGLKRQDIHYYYQNSKIVLDWSHTPSNRSYEAALNGCLLFSYEKNERISEIWTPWKEYVPYNEGNIETLIMKYLDSPEISNAIIGNAKEKLGYLPYSWGSVILAQLKEAVATPVSIPSRIERIEVMPRSVYYHCLSTPYFYNYNYNVNFPINWKDNYFVKINKALSFESEPDSKIVILLDACRMSFVLEQYDKCLNYLEQLEEIKPSYAWIYYLRGRIQRHNKNWQEAIQSLYKAIAYGLQSPSEIKKYFLPYVEKNNTCDNRRLTNYLWHAVLKHGNEFQVNALMYMTYDQIGDILIIANKRGEAIENYQKAITILPVPGSIYKLNNLLYENNDYLNIIEAANLGLSENPYDTRLIIEKASALLAIGEIRECRKLLYDHQKSLKCFKQKRMKYKRAILFILLFISILGIHTAKILSNLISNPLKSLMDKKMGVIFSLRK